MGPDVFQTEMFDSREPQVYILKGMNPDTLWISGTHIQFSLFNNLSKWLIWALCLLEIWLQSIDVPPFMLARYVC